MHFLSFVIVGSCSTIVRTDFHWKAPKLKVFWKPLLSMCSPAFHLLPPQLVKPGPCRPHQGHQGPMALMEVCCQGISSCHILGCGTEPWVHSKGPGGFLLALLHCYPFPFPQRWLGLSLPFHLFTRGFHSKLTHEANQARCWLFAFACPWVLGLVMLGSWGKGLGGGSAHCQAM